MPDTRNLVLKGRTWWAQCAVPRALRPKLSKSNLLANLQTSDLAEAQRRRILAMAAFQQQLDSVAGRPPAGVATRPAASLQETAASWREAREQAEVSGDADQLETVELLLGDEAERIDKLQGEAAALSFYQFASGQSTPIGHHLATCEKESRLAPNTMLEGKAAVKRFASWAAECGLEQVTRKLAGKFVSEVLSEKHPATANKYLSGLSWYWRWLIQRGHVTGANPWLGQRFSKSRRGVAAEVDGERAFTDDEVVRLLNGPAEARLHDAMRIAALSAMRLEEIAMLRVTDCANGVFDIKRAKNANSVRKVPINAALADLIAERSAGKRPDAFLIDGLEDAEGRAPTLSKSFTRYRRALGVDERKEGTRRALTNFHSFRRWFATKADHAGIRDSDVEYVVGHRRQSMLFKHYAKDAAVARLRDCVEAVKLPQGITRVEPGPRPRIGRPPSDQTANADTDRREPASNTPARVAGISRRRPTPSLRASSGPANPTNGRTAG